MQNILQKIGSLIKVKTIVTFVVVAVFSVLALQGRIQPDNVMIVVSSVISFYFGTQQKKETSGI